MISANETQNGKHFRLFPVTETRNVALELGAGGTGRGGVGTAHEPATEARPTQAPRAASPAHASWQSRPCPGPGPGCSPPPASAPRRCHGNLRSGSEATHAPQAKPRFPGLETWKQALPTRRARGRAQRFPTPPGYFRRNRSLHRQSLLSHLGGPAIGTVTGRGGPTLAFGAESTLAAGRGQGTSVTQRF